MNIIKPGFQMGSSQIRVQRIQQWWMVGLYKIQQTTHHQTTCRLCMRYTLPHPFKSSSRGTKLGMLHFFQQMKTRMSRTNPTFVQKKTSRTNDCSFQNKTAVLKSKTPTITELVKEPSPWKQSERQPELVEFEDGASDVPFTTVPFLPALHSQNRENSVGYMAII